MDKLNIFHSLLHFNILLCNKISVCLIAGNQENVTGQLYIIKGNLRFHINFRFINNFEYRHEISSQEVALGLV